jgi:hypothetical protein
MIGKFQIYLASIHDASLQRSSGALGHDIDYSNMELLQENIE